RGGRGGRKWTHGTRPVGTPEPRGVSQSAPPALSQDHGEPAGLGTTLRLRAARATVWILLCRLPCSWCSLRSSQRSLRLCVELAFLYGSGFVGLGNRTKIPPVLSTIPTVIRAAIRTK